MHTKLLLFALTIISAIALSSCASTTPVTHYPPSYRIYQDKPHGGMTNYGDVYNRNGSEGYMKNGKRDGNSFLGGK